MFPLYILLIIWIILLLAYSVMALLSVIQMLRFGVATPGTTFSTTVYLILTGIVLFATTIHLLGVDWMQTVDLFGEINGSTQFTL